MVGLDAAGMQVDDIANDDDGWCYDIDGGIYMYDVVGKTTILYKLKLGMCA